MCAICGIPNVLPCNCVSQQPFCDQCADDTKCYQEMDSQCVIYHQNTSVPTKLTCIGMPNGSSVEAILEKIDRLVCSQFNYPLVAVDSPSIDFTQSGNAGHTITADVNISTQSGNILSILADGLYAPDLRDGKVRVNASTPARYLEDAVIGATDGCVSISVETDDSGLLVIHPTLAVDCLSELLCANDAFTLCIGNSLCSSDNFVNCIQASLCGNEDFQACVLAIVGPVGGATANNGLHIDGGSGDVYLGGTLVETTTISHGSGPFQLSFINSPNISIGTATAQTQSSLYIEDITSTKTTALNVSKQTAILNANVVSAEVFNRLVGTTFTSSGSTIVHNDSVDAQLNISYSGAVVLQNSHLSTYSGLYGTIIKSGAGNISGNTITAGYFGSFAADAGNISAMAGVRIAGPEQSSSFGAAYTGVITNFYGLYINDVAGAALGTATTNKFAIYQEGPTDISRFFGPVQNASSSVQFTSDIRVKENIVDFTLGLTEIDQIKTHKFNYTYNKTRTVVGVIAQELETILPDAVEKGNFDVPNGESYTDFRMVDQTQLFYTMLNAIKELSAKVKALEAK